MKNKKFSSIENIIKIAKKGEMYILVDDENRENEGDLVIPAINVSQKNINFMAMYGRGLICLSLTNKQAKKLNLSLMSPINLSRNQTAFTVSIEARKGVTTGISAKDRSITIRTAIKSNVKKNDIVSPGHIFPIISKEGGVLVRAGHTEASVDISKLAKKNPSAVICEIMNDRGVMAKGNELFNFAKKHKLKIKIQGIPALSSFIFQNNHQAYKTFITQEMLKKGFLSANSVYVCTEHTSAIIDEYFELLDPVFATIGECENGRNIDDLLEGPVCHARFKRLN